MAQIKLAQIFQQFTDNQGIVEVHGSTVFECINELINKYPETRKWIFGSASTPNVMILLNQNLILPDKLDKKVTPTDKIEIYPMIAGG